MQDGLKHVPVCCEIDDFFPLFKFRCQLLEGDAVRHVPRTITVFAFLVICRRRDQLHQQIFHFHSSGFTVQVSEIRKRQVRDLLLNLLCVAKTGKDTPRDVAMVECCDRAVISTLSSGGAKNWK